MDLHPGTILSCPIRAVLCDIGGVFLPWPSPAFFLDWARRLSIPPDQFQQRLWYGPDIEAANIGTITAEEYYHRCAERLSVDANYIRVIIEAAFAGEPLNTNLV